VFTVFGVQLVLNFLWSLLFFGLKCPGCALIDIALLLISIALTMVLFFRISRTASLLFIPYLLWVSFASVLNYYLFVLN
jgi:tryptophan-rich sensory protein